MPVWDRCHDTTFLAFLDDPHAKAVGLKESAHRLLGLAPEERDAVADWLVSNQPVPGVRITRKSAGAYIAYAPGDVVGPYACGDVDRTEALFRHLYPRVVERGMLGAYDRERRLVPVLLDMERRGIRVDVQRLRRDVDAFGDVLARLEAWVRRRIGASEDVNLDSGQQLVSALVAAGLADVSRMGVTDTGLVKSDKAAIAAGVADAQLAAVLRYLAQLKTCLGTFMRPWLATAERSGGLIFCTWNQIRGGEGGARTGRFSSTPNLMNIPTEFASVFSAKRGDGLPKAPFKVPDLPMCRSYIVAGEGRRLIGRDFASQELRVLAHFEDAGMMEAYVQDPSIDFHGHAAELITRITGVPMSRKGAKTIGFAILYGAGVTKLSMQLGVSYDEAKRFLEAYLKVFPSIREMQKDLKRRSQADQAIRTVGGREYMTEPPAIVNGRIREFSYKLLNYLVQGSSADVTKDAMLRFYDRAGPGYLLLSVHDELLASAPERDADRVMGLLRDSMNDAGLDVPMLSDGETGYNWGAMETWDESKASPSASAPRARDAA